MGTKNYDKYKIFSDLLNFVMFISDLLNFVMFISDLLNR